MNATPPRTTRLGLAVRVPGPLELAVDPPDRDAPLRREVARLVRDVLEAGYVRDRATACKRAYRGGMTAEQWMAEVIADRVLRAVRPTAP